MSIKVLVLGSSGIVGQHMRLSVPPGVEALFYRQTADPITPGFDLLSTHKIHSWLDSLASSSSIDCIVNLAGESNPDTVEKKVNFSHFSLNVTIPQILSSWCVLHSAKLIQISTQAVFSGENPPYSPGSITNPVNRYGVHKCLAEIEVLSAQQVVVRLTFVLGVRPMPNTGRKNPLEAMLDGSQTRQVDNRFFSPLFARDAADGIWDAVLNAAPGEIRHLGIPEKWSRYEIACQLDGNPVSSAKFGAAGPEVLAVPHESFPGLAPRPMDTTYANPSNANPSSLGHVTDTFSSGLLKCYSDYSELNSRAREIALFLGLREDVAVSKLRSGFGALHASVTEDFLRYSANQSTDRLLDWYRQTEAYIWELSCYHMDSTGFNYSGMCKGVIERIKNEVCKVTDGPIVALNLGDGIGDLTLAMSRTPGFLPYYHDLEGSKTAAFARFRHWNQTGKELNSKTFTTATFSPETFFRTSYHVITSLDFLEHVPNVEDWVRTIHSALVPGGVFVAQNAFAIGSGAHGDSSMPMHLAQNDKYEFEWDRLLTEVGFVAMGPQWYRKAS